MANLTGWMFGAMGLGLLVGFARPGLAAPFSIAAPVFLQLIRSAMAPVLFAVLVSAVASMPDGKRMRSLGWRAVLYFEVVSALALVLGWIFVVVAQPGQGITLPASTSATAGAIPDLSTILLSPFPTSIFDAMARGDVLQVVVFSLLFGLAAARVGKGAGAMVRFADSLAAVMFQYVRYIMLLAPLAIFASVANTVANTSSMEGLLSLGKFIVLAWAAQLTFLFVVQGGSLVLTRVPLRRFLAAMREPFLVATATTSSVAAMPQLLANLERWGAPKLVLGIIPPISLSFNATGSCIHLAMATAFVAQASHTGLSLLTQVAILLTLKLTSKGVAGIPRANFVILAGLFSTFGLPPEGLALLLGVDALIDPIRTGVNVMGHGVAAAVFTQWEENRGVTG